MWQTLRDTVHERAVRILLECILVVVCKEGMLRKLALRIRHCLHVTFLASFCQQHL